MNRLQNMQKNKAKKKRNVRRRPEIFSAPMTPFEAAFGEGLVAFFTSIFLDSFNRPTEVRKVPKQLPGPKKGEVQLESGVYLSGKGVK